MTWALVRHALRTRRLAVIWFSVGMFGFSLLVMALWPSSSDIDFSAYLEGMPEGLRAAFLGSAFNEEAVVESFFYQYLASQYTTWAPLVLAYFGIWVGSGVIAREFDRDTLDLLLAQPVTRTRFVIAKFSAVILAAIPIIVVSALGLIIGVILWGEGVELSGWDTILIHVNLLIFTAATAALGMVFASLFLEPGRSYGLGAAVVIGMYLLNVVAQVVDPLEWSGYISLFRYWQPLEQYITGEFDWFNAVALVAIAAAGLFGTIIIFRRRDIAA